jgi:hypothetical protein
MTTYRGEKMNKEYRIIKNVDTARFLMQVHEDDVWRDLYDGCSTEADARQLCMFHDHLDWQLTRGKRK